MSFDIGTLRRLKTRCLSRSASRVKPRIPSLRFAASVTISDTVAICNVPGSSLTESRISFDYLSQPEIGVASTKAFTSQLIALSWLALALKRIHRPDMQAEIELVKGLQALPKQVDDLLTGQVGAIEEMAEAWNRWRFIPRPRT